MYPFRAQNPSLRRLHEEDTGRHDCVCENCGWRGPEVDLKEPVDIMERVAPGEIMPAGECPQCGCLAQVDSGYTRALGAAEPMLRALQAIQPHISEPSLQSQIAFALQEAQAAVRIVPEIADQVAVPPPVLDAMTMTRIADHYAWQTGEFAGIEAVFADSPTWAWSAYRADLSRNPWALRACARDGRMIVFDNDKRFQTESEAQEVAERYNGLRGITIPDGALIEAACLDTRASLEAQSIGMTG